MTLRGAFGLVSSFTGPGLSTAARYFLRLNVPENIGFREADAKSWKKFNFALCKPEILLLYATSLTQRAPVPR
jgi:hypothetical protein